MVAVIHGDDDSEEPADFRHTPVASIVPQNCRGANRRAVSRVPAGPWLAVPGLLALTAVLVLLAALRLRRLEINYGAE
jgi:hypothetical protein